MIFNMTGGGNNPLNFQVKTYQSETELKADKPKDNTIGVITTTTMASWVFSAMEPSKPEAGMVWIKVGIKSGVEFNALKKNALQVYPLSANQYDGSKFVDKVAFNYIDEEWLDFVTVTYLYNSGDECNELTGGWSARAWALNSNFTTKVPTLTKNNSNMTISLSNPSDYTSSGVIQVEKDIDVTNVKTIRAKFKNITASISMKKEDEFIAIGVMIVQRSAIYFSENAAAKSSKDFIVSTTMDDVDIEVDVSKITGSYDVVISLALYSSNTSSITAVLESVEME